MLTKTKPYEHQLTAYNKAYGQKFFALFMEMGTGKTKVSIDLASNYFNDMEIDAVLVVAPNSVHRQWAEEEIPKHCPVPYETLTWSASKSKTKKFQKAKDSFMKSDKLKFFCVNIETFSCKNYLPMVREYLKSNRCLMIIDESTTIKNPDAKRTETILAMSELPVKKLILTGTPVTNSPFDLWGQFNFLDYGFFNCDYFMFQHRYGMMIREKRENYLGEDYTCIRNMRMWEIAKYRGIVEKVRRDHYEDKNGENLLVKALDFDDAVEKVHLTSGVSEKTLRYICLHEDIRHPYKGLEKIKSKIDPYTYTVKKEDCLDLPEKIFQPIYVEMSPEQRRIYKSAKKYMMATYNNDDLTVKNKLSLMLRLQQITGGFFPHDPELGEKQEPKLIGKKTSKFARIEQDLQEVDCEAKIIIWCKFTSEIRYLRRELNKLYPEDRTETYYGANTTTQKAEVKKDFMDGKIRFLIANKQSAGIGLNLQRSTLHYNYSQDFSLERELQAQDRSHRIGQTKHVVYKDTVVRDSIDELIHKALKSKKDLLEFFREKSLRELLSDKEIVF